MDYNNDGYIDLMAGDRDGDLWLFTRNPDGSLDAPGTIYADSGAINAGFNCSPLLVDWDEDGYLDLLVGGHYTETTNAGFLHLYLNSDTHTDSLVFTSFIDLDFYHLWRSTQEMYDLDLDGAKDLIIGYEGGQVYFAHNEGTNSAPLFSSYTPLESNGTPIDVGSRARETVNDWNEDGIPDLIVGNTTNDKLQVFLGRQTGVTEDRGVQLSAEYSMRILGSPAQGLFSISLVLPESAMTNVLIYSLDGRNIMNFDRYFQTGLTVFPCDLSNQVPGVYLIVIDTVLGQITGRMVLLE